MNETIAQMRQKMTEKIKSMRRATYGDIKDGKYNEAWVAFNTAETWYTAAFNKKRWMHVYSCRSQFEIAEKRFWKFVKGGAQ